MQITDLMCELIDRQLTVRRKGPDRLEIVGQLSLLTPEMQQSLVDHRDIFLQATSWPQKRAVRIGAQEFEYDVWNGEQLNGTIAIDTETMPIDKHKRPSVIPQLALASVSDGNQHCLVHPDRLEEFIEQHKTHHFVCHNAVFDWNVVFAHLNSVGKTWFQVLDDGRLHDTMILDGLIRLARDDTYPRNRDLGTVAREYCGLLIDKSDPYRLRYEEIIDKNWDDVDEGFFQYAIKDAIVTHEVFAEQQRQANELLRAYSDQLLPSAIEKYGLLTESLQVKANIVLDESSNRNGLSLDRNKVQATKKALVKNIDELAQSIQAMPEGNGLFKTDKDGRIKTTAQSGKPCIQQSRLVSNLERIEATHDEIAMPRSAKRQIISLSVKEWKQYSQLDWYRRWLGAQFGRV